MSKGTINKVILIGHTGDTVKMHHFESGGCIGRVSLATNESYTNKSTGQVVENTEWHNLVFRNKAAEIVEKHLDKGAKVYIEGKIKTRKWQDENGNDRYSTEIHVWDFTFLSSKGNQNNGGETSNGSTGGAAKDPGQKFEPTNQDDYDDLPF